MGNLKVSEALGMFDKKHEDLVISKKTSLINMVNDDSLTTLFRLDEIHDAD